MNCAEARERMLVADPSFLQGQEVGGGDLEAADRRLVDHLEGCASCRRRARVLAAGQRRLARALAAAAAEIGAAREPAAVGIEDGTGASSRPGWRTAAAGAAVAAAAALALWLVPGGLDRGGGRSSPVVEIQGASGAGGFELEAPSGGDVAVFRTADPDVIVVWRLGDDGSS